MKLLLDTHVLLWSIEESARLNEITRREIESGENLVLVSLVSLWELEIKQSLGKFKIPERFYQRLPGYGFGILSITLNHVQAVGTLPFLHRDPFDRMLVAQAKAEQLTLVTRDEDIMGYDVPILKA